MRNYLCLQRVTATGGTVRQPPDPTKPGLNAVLLGVDGETGSPRSAIEAARLPSRKPKLHPTAYPVSRRAGIRLRYPRPQLPCLDKAMSDRQRALPVFGLITLLLTASFTYAESKNDAKSYDAVVSKASRDLTDGKIDDAAKDAQQAGKLDPNNPETANLLGIVASKKKDYPEAISQFNRALTESPKFYGAKFNLADALMLQGNYDQARSTLEDLRQIDPKSEIVQFRLALDYVLANQPDKAMALIDGMDFPGKTPAYYYARAAVWLKKGLVKDATQYGVNAHKYYTDGQCSYFVSVLREMGLNVSVL
jgi:tetratricopeptide (TPR) repeat protein